MKNAEERVLFSKDDERERTCKRIIMNAVSTVYGCSSMTARSKWLSWAPPNFITNLETEYVIFNFYLIKLHETCTISHKSSEQKNYFILYFTNYAKKYI